MQRDGTVHVVDDDADVLESIRFLLDVHDLSVRTYSSADRFLRCVEHDMTGCIFSDVRMPGMDGIELLRHLRRENIRLPFVVMTGHADVPMAVEAMKEGATDFLEKPFDQRILVELAITGLNASRVSVAERSRTAMIRQRLGSLTGREREVLKAVAKGRSSKLIAYDLGLSTRTVDVHRANIRTKLGVENAAAAVSMLMDANMST